MSEKKLTIIQILKALEGLSVSEDDKFKLLQKLLNSNQPESMENSINSTVIGDTLSNQSAQSVSPVIGLAGVETIEAPVNPQSINVVKTGLKAKFWNLSKSFAPAFSSKFENKIAAGNSYVESSSVTAIIDEEETMNHEKINNFFENIKDYAYNLGVTISHIGHNLPGGSLTKKIISVLKFNGEATAVAKVERNLKEMIDTNNLSSLNNANPNLIIQEIDEKEEINKIVTNHTEKYNYQFDTETGEIIFNSYINVSTNEKLNYLRRVFSHDLKEDLDNNVKYRQALANNKRSKNILLLDTYAKQVDIHPDDVMQQLRLDNTACNLPEHPLLARLIKNKVAILNESISISNEMIKTNLEYKYLINISDKMLNYVRSLPANELNEANKEIKKNFIIDFANKTFGVNKLGILIEKFKDDKLQEKNLALQEGANKKLDVDRANELVISLNSSINKFIAKVDEMHQIIVEKNEKIDKLMEIESPTTEQIHVIEQVKLEIKNYLTEYSATYQSFGESYSNQETELGALVTSFRNAKHSAPNDSNLKNKQNAKAHAEAEKYNSNLLHGLSNSVQYIVNTHGSLGRLEEQMINHITKECAIKFRAFDNLDAQYKKLIKKHPSEKEILYKKAYSKSSDLMTCFLDLQETHSKFQLNISETNKNFKNLIKTYNKLDEGELKKRSLSNLNIKIKSSLEMYEKNQALLESELAMKFSAFKRIYTTRPNARSEIKEYSQSVLVDSIDVRRWIDSQDPLAKLSEGFEISKNIAYKSITVNYQEILQKRDELVKKMEIIVATEKSIKEEKKVAEVTVESKDSGEQKPKVTRKRKNNVVAVPKVENFHIQENNFTDTNIDSNKIFIKNKNDNSNISYSDKIMSITAKHDNMDKVGMKKK